MESNLARAAVRVAVGVVVGLAAVGPMQTVEARCPAQVAFRENAPARPAGTGEPWPLWLWEQPDPDRLRPQCEDVGIEPRLHLPLWNGPAWGVPSLGSFV